MKNLVVFATLILFAFANTNFLTSHGTGSCETCCSTLSKRAPMTYTYYIKTAHFVGGSGEWAINTKGYSGAGAGLNNPAYSCVKNVGPLPPTTYKIAYCKDTMHTPAVTRPCAFYLEPQDNSKMCGRSEFFIHGCQCCTKGDTTVPPVGGCSAGCIVITHDERIKLRVGDTIHVVASE